MLTLDIQSILNSIPNEISWQDIVQFEKLDDVLPLLMTFVLTLLVSMKVRSNGVPTTTRPIV
ncbi:hypothetical protein [Tychonema sp. LEGE 07203]|uniref:hypothetical protein n=1 Tax=Tychonema sp. LEGE 07203 TaxID=1828671 RepID=UPI001D146E68|nr:hypothetical protein [Tychonema sp. LEGE 07203]